VTAPPDPAQARAAVARECRDFAAAIRRTASEVDPTDVAFRAWLHGRAAEFELAAITAARIPKEGASR
jgi:hypothetical protein